MSNLAKVRPSDATEQMRIRAIRETQLKQGERRPAFDRITEMLSLHFKCDIAHLTFVDEHKQWFLSKQGVDFLETPREISFCDHVVCGNKPLLVNDASKDVRFANSPLVTRKGGIRSYLGVPLVLNSGITVGAVCVADPRENWFAHSQISDIQLIAKIAQDVITAQIAERKTRETSQVLKENKKCALMAKTLLESAERIAGIGSWSVSPDLQDLIWSEGTYHLHEVHPDVRISVREAVHYYAKDDQKLVMDHLADAIKNKAGYEFEATIVTAKGRHRRIKCVGNYIVGSRHIEDRLVGVIRAID